VVATWGKSRRGGSGALTFFAIKWYDLRIFYKVFFQRYFAQKHGKEQVKATKADKRKAKPHDSDTESDGMVKDGSGDEDSDLEEAAIWKVRLTGYMRPVLLIEPIQAMKASMPKAEDDEDEDVDGNDDGDDDDDVDVDIDDDEDSPVDYSIQDSESDEHASSDTGDQSDEGSSVAEDNNINVDWEFDGIGFSDADNSVKSRYPSVPGRRNLQYIKQAGSDTRLAPALGDAKTPRKRKGHGDGDERKSKKKRLRDLPTFASYEDYARMIEDGPEENI